MRIIPPILATLLVCAPAAGHAVTQQYKQGVCDGLRSGGGWSPEHRLSVIDHAHHVYWTCGPLADDADPRVSAEETPASIP